MQEIATRHVAAPAIAASHQLRVISADKGERLKVVENLKMPEPSKSDKKVDPEFLKVVEKAVYGCILGAFVQGLDVSTGSDIADSRSSLVLRRTRSGTSALRLACGSGEPAASSSLVSDDMDRANGRRHL